MAIDGRQYKGTKIGKKIEGEAVRGAIHVAVLPVVIDGFLRAGDFFMLKPGSKENGHPVATRTNRESSIGIIDPFLVDEYANAGDFWEISMSSIWQEIRQWQEGQFGGTEKRNWRGPLAHLGKELDEVEQSGGSLEEVVDVLFLASEVCWRLGVQIGGVGRSAWRQADRWDISTPMALRASRVERVAHELAPLSKIPDVWLALKLFGLAIELIDPETTEEELEAALRAKLEKNKARQWGKWSEGGVIEHVR